MKIAKRASRISGLISTDRLRNCTMKDIPTPVTSSAPRARCLSSLRLNQNILVEDFGE